MQLLILGPQGSGKGTQGERVAEHFGLAHISSGDIFRDNIARQTPLGIKVQERIRAGQLVDDSTTIAMIKDRLGAPDCAKGAVLEGFPRTVSQAEALDAIAPPDAVISLEIDDDEAIARITGRRICSRCGRGYHVIYVPPKHDGVCDDDAQPLVHRDDDTPEAIARRLEQYHAQTEPLLAHYREQGKLRVIDANRSIEQVYQQILFKLRMGFA
jgi:adenylate kinase